MKRGYVRHGATSLQINRHFRLLSVFGRLFVRRVTPALVQTILHKLGVSLIRREAAPWWRHVNKVVNISATHKHTHAMFEQNQKTNRHLEKFTASSSFQKFDHSLKNCQ